MNRRLKKSDIEGLSALQTRMALILLRVNGIENAKEFIVAVEKRNASTSPNTSKGEKN